jgi:V8-like Glu-specific endopeptidase
MKTISTIMGLLLWIIFASTSQSETVRIDPQKVGKVETVHYESPKIDPIESQNRRYWLKTISKPGTRFIRLRLKVLSASDRTTAFIHIRTRSQPNALKFDLAGKKVGEVFWTGDLRGPMVVVSLIAPEPPVGAKLLIDRIAFTTNPGKISSIIGLDQRERVSDLAGNPIVSSSEGAVAKLSFIKDNNMYVCTGFMIDKEHLITNEHCVNTQDICASTQAIFGFQYSDADVLNPGQGFECKDLAEVDYGLDYAILKIDGRPGEKWGYLNLAEADTYDGQELIIIQHPGGEPKQVSIQDCATGVAVADGRDLKTDFSHICDTMGGSSGSPVITLQGKVVGLHHFGVGGGYWNENRAVRMRNIIQNSAVIREIIDGDDSNQ